MLVRLKPFWRYYGGKWRATPHYPKPAHGLIVEPFAGAAGYSLNYSDRDVLLVEKYPVVAEMWRWLISAAPSEIRAIPETDSVDDLPEWVPAGARALVGFSMNSAGSTPRRTLSAGRRMLRAAHRQFEGWTPALRERVATQVQYIRHWRVIEGDYTLAPDTAATWFIDPPYNNAAGRHYPHHRIDYAALAVWAKARDGQLIVCENAGADWLPFRSLGTFKAQNGGTTAEVIYP